MSNVIEDPVKNAINALIASLTAQHEQDQRATPRMAFHLPITLHHKTQCGAYKLLDDAFGLNISHNGIEFISATHYRKDTILSININHATGGKPFFLPISIKHSTPAFGTNFVAGGQFLVK